MKPDKNNAKMLYFFECVKCQQRRWNDRPVCWCTDCEEEMNRVDQSPQEDKDNDIVAF